MKIFAVMLSLLLGLGLPALSLALTLDEAKAQGLVGEKADGFVAAVAPGPAPDVQALVEATNEGRRKVYAELAQRNGITPQAVAALSAEKLRGAAAPGEYLQNAAGQWQRK